MTTYIHIFVCSYWNDYYYCYGLHRNRQTHQQQFLTLTIKCERPATNFRRLIFVLNWALISFNTHCHLECSVPNYLFQCDFGSENMSWFCKILLFQVKKNEKWDFIWLSKRFRFEWCWYRICEIRAFESILHHFHHIT